MAFQASVARKPELSKREWFLVHPKGLVARREGDRVVFPEDADVALAGVDPASPEVHAIGQLDDSEALAAAVAAPPPGFETLGLRALAAALEGERFGVAGR